MLATLHSVERTADRFILLTNRASFKIDKCVLLFPLLSSQNLWAYYVLMFFLEREIPLLNVASFSKVNITYFRMPDKNSFLG